jgi:protein-L-isoaspartate(D-aspartate) O-methyltransferase
VSAEVAALRERLIDALIARNYLHDARVIDAFRAVPRHLFVPSEPLDRAYSEESIITRRDERGVPTSSSSQPGVVAVMLEQLELAPGMRVLEIGAGTGYNAALIARLVRPGGAVTTIDVQPDVASEARAHLDAAGLGDVDVRDGDGWLGAADRAPFDRIEATVSVRDVSPAWVAQLAADGVVLVPLALRAGGQLLVAFERDGERLVSRSVRGGGFMPLRRPGLAPATYRDVAGWRVVADLAPDDLAVLEEVLAETPRVERAAIAQQAPFLRLGLDRPDAISLANADGWGAFGLFDSERRSLAAFREGELIVFGRDDARELLLSWASTARGIETLHFEALPRGATIASGALAVLEREHHTIVVRER